jgi:hypothetical protein
MAGRRSYDTSELKDYIFLLFNKRICNGIKDHVPDPTPTLVDIERTHILFVNAHFKPFAAIGYEYNKVQPAAGNPVYGNGVQFSIPRPQRHSAHCAKLGNKSSCKSMC